MANWESEASKALFQKELEISSRLERIRMGNTERENQITSMITSYYEQTVLPGYELLDRYGIREKLTEIRDQVWGGEVEKNTTSFDQYRSRIIEFATNRYSGIKYKLDILPFQLDTSNYPNQFKLSVKEKETINNIIIIYPARYILSSANILCCVTGRDYNEIACHQEEIRVTTDGSSLNINNFMLENLIGTNPTTIKEWIHDTLLEECVDFKKRRKDVLKHPGYQNYLEKFTPTP